MKISIAIPVYRNAGSIRATYDEIVSVFASSLHEYDLEIVFVDDGSDDTSLHEILEIRSKDPRVKALSFTRNFGQMAAILAGLKEVTGDAVISISADMQDPVELIPKMVDEWRAGSEIVICHRANRADSATSRFYSRLAYGSLRLTNPSLPTGGFDYVLIDRKALDAFNAIDVRNRFFQGDLLWTGYRTKFIPYERRKREIGRSQYTFWKKLKNFLDAFLDSSYVAIRVISAAGLLTSFLGLLYAISITYAWLKGETPFTGWAPIMIVLLFVGGAIMVMLGVIGEYVWRIYDEVRKKPNFIIRDKYL
jgi:polyisoprenyl-phosphate glycosyltransferase